MGEAFLAEENVSSVDVGELGELAGYHLRRANNVFQAHFAQTMEGTGIRQVLFGILSVDARNPGINQGSVGRALGIQRANMVALINELVDSELIDRQVSPDDRRAFALSLTEAGQSAFNDNLARIRAHEERLLAGLDARERDTLLVLLGKIEARET